LYFLCGYEISTLSKSSQKQTPNQFINSTGHIHQKHQDDDWIGDQCSKPDGSGTHAFAHYYSQHLKNARAWQNMLNRERIYR